MYQREQRVKYRILLGQIGILFSVFILLRLIVNLFIYLYSPILLFKIYSAVKPFIAVFAEKICAEALVFAFPACSAPCGHSASVAVKGHLCFVYVGRINIGYEMRFEYYPVIEALRFGVLYIRLNRIISYQLFYAFQAEHGVCRCPVVSFFGKADLQRLVTGRQADLLRSCGETN